MDLARIITIDGVCISELGFSEELQQAPAFVNALAIITKLMRKESFALRKKIDKLETFKKRQEKIICSLIEDFDAELTSCTHCGIYVAYDQELMRGCYCYIHSCNWCFDAGRYPESWIPQNEVDDGVLWCTECENTITKL